MTRPDTFKTYRLPLIGGAIFILLFSFAFFEREIHNDEAWIGQQVLSLVVDGTITSELFRDLPPLDQEIVVYHKLLVWAGSTSSLVFGWGLYSLRAISAISGLVLLLLILTVLRRRLSAKVAAFTILILMFAPIYWEQMLEFRPEALLVLCGFTGFLVLWHAVETESYVLYLIAGILSGLAGLAHAFGFACVIAGIVAVIAARRWKGAVLFGIAGVTAFLPYLSGYISQPELFRQQLLENQAMTTSFDFKWWHVISNLLTEHKRVLRKPEVIGITISFLLSLLLISRDQWRKYRFLMIYLATLFVLIGASPLPKFTRYMIPLVPPMAVIIAQVWENLAEGKAQGRRWAAVMFLIWQVVFFSYGTYALLHEAVPDDINQLQTNESIKVEIPEGSAVIAPFDFVFPADPVMTIQSWWGAVRHDRTRHDVEILERYADSLRVEYLLIGPLALEHWRLDDETIMTEFKRYRFLNSWATGTKEPRYLLMRD